jgi:hypothetical protein
VGTFGFGNIAFNPEEDIQNDISDQCYVTGNGGGQIGDDDVDNGETVLVSPVMDLSTYGSPKLKYYRWFANGGGQGNPNDTLRIEISNGQTTVVLSRVIGLTQNFWKQDSFLLSNYIAITNNMRARFICGDYGQGHVTEGGVDGFEVVESEATAITPSSAHKGILEVYPNPLEAGSYLRFDLNGPIVDAASVEIHDAMGRLVMRRDITTHTGLFQLERNLPAGIYVASLRNGGSVIGSQKLIQR